MVLVDAYSQIFRAFYAVRMLTNSRGDPINAAYVFTKLLLQLEKCYASRYGAMLFDCGKVAFRLELNPLYKANRPPMPEALRKQMPLIRKIAGAFGWTLMQYEDFEADDLIGAMVNRYRDIPVEIVSGDKDLSQLIDDRVSMLIPRNGGGFERRGEREVVEKFGVAPGEIVDYLSLLGDSSDNIPGVPGIGPKGAVEVLRRFGAAEAWLNSPEKIDPEHRLAKKLLPALDVVSCNRKLIQLRTDLPPELDKGVPPVRREPDWRMIAEICRNNQFNSILKELPDFAESEDSPVEQYMEDDLFSFAAGAEKSKIHIDTDNIGIQGELF